MSKSRSEQMACIKGKNTLPELELRKALWRIGCRYRLHQRIEGTRPDLVFPKHKIAVFVDGCFWHGCPEHYVRPRSTSVFWAKKLAENVERDRRQTKKLEGSGWIVLRYWEHEIMKNPDAVAQSVRRVLINGNAYGIASRWVAVRVNDKNDGQDGETWVLQDLRNPLIERHEARTRSTAKW